MGSTSLLVAQGRVRLYRVPVPGWPSRRLRHGSLPRMWTDVLSNPARLQIRSHFWAGLRDKGPQSEQPTTGALDSGEVLRMDGHVRHDGDALRVEVQPQPGVGCSASPPMAASDARSAQGLGMERPGSTEVASMQHPILTPHDGGSEDAIPIWEGRAQVDLAVMISRYLAEHPPPGPTPHLSHWTAWADDLRRSGEVRLEAMAARRLRSA